MECKLSVASKNNFGQQQSLLLVVAAVVATSTAVVVVVVVRWGSVDILNNCCALGTLHSAAAHCIAFGGSRSKTATQPLLLPAFLFVARYDKNFWYPSQSPASLYLLPRSLCCLVLSLLPLPVSLCALLAFFSLGLFTFRSVEFSQRLLEPHRVKHSRFGFSYGFIADKAIGHKASAIHPSIHPSAIDYRFVCWCCVCERLSVAIA